AALLDQAVPIDGIERIDTLDAGGRVLAEDIRSALAVPPMDNSQMDGYALRSADVQGASDASPARLRVAQRIAAGQVGVPLDPGTAARIFTGAMLPDGADAVVMQEVTAVDGDDVLVRQAARPGEWV